MKFVGTFFYFALCLFFTWAAYSNIDDTITETMVCDRLVFGHAVFNKFEFTFTTNREGSARRSVAITVNAHRPSDEEAERLGYWTDDTSHGNPIASKITGLSNLPTTVMPLRIIGYASGKISFAHDSDDGQLLIVNYGYEMFDALGIFACDKKVHQLFR